MCAGAEKFPVQNGSAEKTVHEDRSIKCQVLSGLELCRQAQIVTNEACLNHISQGCEGDAVGLQSAVEVCVNCQVVYHCLTLLWHLCWFKEQN